jgi:hypothetical protein
MMVAFPSRVVARRTGLNRNHHLRVWCTCMEDSVSEPGTYAGQHSTVVNPRTAEQAASDPRRCGGWDHLAVVDAREPGSALAAWREHLDAAA